MPPRTHLPVTTPAAVAGIAAFGMLLPPECIRWPWRDHCSNYTAGMPRSSACNQPYQAGRQLGSAGVARGCPARSPLLTSSWQSIRVWRSASLSSVGCSMQPQWGNSRHQMPATAFAWAAQHVQKHATTAVVPCGPGDSITVEKAAIRGGWIPEWPACAGSWLSAHQTVLLLLDQCLSWCN